MVTSGTALVRVARHAVGAADARLMAVGLGSCVAVILHDRVAAVGGMAHVLLPEPSTSVESSNPFKFARTAVPHLLAAVEESGASRTRLDARLVGGASMFASLMNTQVQSMGERNVAASRAALEEAGVPVCGEDVGGEYGRMVEYDLRSGAVRVSTISREDLVL